MCSIGAAGMTNVQGEEQKKLDVLSNDIMINSLRASGKVALMVSEENVRTHIETIWYNF
jgi:fructose-1,6-bisphosphatase I